MSRGRVNKSVRLIGAIVAAGVLAALTACSSDPSRGYAMVSAYDDSIKTVSVEMFDNRTYSPGLEVDLTDAIVKEVQRRTPWRVTSGETADATLHGSITASRLRQLSTSPKTGLVLEMGVELSVDFELRDARTGRVITSRKDFRAIDTFVPTQASGRERLTVGELGVAQRLGSDIVAELRTAW